MASESWVGSETFINGQNAGSSWDICQLGADFLPGVVTIDNLEVGRDIDVQKRRKKEKARIRDNGLSPVTFDIIIELKAADWAAWLRILPNLQPKEGGTRTPLGITHPLVNAYGVTEIYIHKIKNPAPSARRGARIEIHVGEWFEEEKDADQSKKPKVTPPNKVTSETPSLIGRGLQGEKNPAGGFPIGPVGGSAGDAIRRATEAKENAADNLFGEP
jgi:hypothetical protein